MQENKYHNTIEEQPLNGAHKPPEGWVYVGNNNDCDDAIRIAGRSVDEAIFGCWFKGGTFNDGAAGTDGGTAYYIREDSPFLKKKDSPWITDRLPTREDSGGSLDTVCTPAPPHDDGWFTKGWRGIQVGEPWAPYPKFPPYVSPTKEVPFDCIADFGGQLPAVFRRPNGVHFPIDGILVTDVMLIHINGGWVRVSHLLSGYPRWSSNPDATYEECHPFSKTVPA